MQWERLEQVITTCCPECGAVFKTYYTPVSCLNCSVNSFDAKENEILTDMERELECKR